MGKGSVLQLAIEKEIAAAIDHWGIKSSAVAVAQFSSARTRFSTAGWRHVKLEKCSTWNTAVEMLWKS
jgi:hypothetical protein